jgi:hypothetical protein
LLFGTTAVCFLIPQLWLQDYYYWSHTAGSEAGAQQHRLVYSSFGNSTCVSMLHSCRHMTEMWGSCHPLRTAETALSRQCLECKRGATVTSGCWGRHIMADAC